MRTITIAGIVATVAVLSVVAATFLASGSDDERTRYSISIIEEYGGSSTGAGEYPEGSVVTLCALPYEGYDLEGWYDGDEIVSTYLEYTFEVTSYMGLRIVFKDAIHTVNVISNDPSGGHVIGGGDVSHSHYAELIANIYSGYRFDGWYEDECLITLEDMMSHTAVRDTTIEGRFSPMHEASFIVSLSSPVTPMEMTLKSTEDNAPHKRIWTITDTSTDRMIAVEETDGYDTTFNLEIEEGMILRIDHSVVFSEGRMHSTTMTKVIDDIEGRDFNWKYQMDTWYSAISNVLNLNNRSANISLPISFEDHQNALDADVPRKGSFGRLGEFITVDDESIKVLTSMLAQITHGMVHVERVNCILKMVQSIPYEDDIVNGQPQDYWNLPVETLWKQSGDCEDHALLFATLMEAMGYDTVIHYVMTNTGKAHIAVGVSIPGATGSYVEVDGIEYYYCEATASVGGSLINRVEVGDIPSGFDIQSTYVV